MKPMDHDSEVIELLADEPALVNGPAPAAGPEPIELGKEQWDLIHVYSRAHAIRDGVLIDVSKVAAEAGIRWPVALTSAVWANYVTVPPGVDCQDEAGRLWDVVFMLAMAARARPAHELLYTVYVRNDNRRARPVTLKALAGPGDDGGPAITVMLPEED